MRKWKKRKVVKLPDFVAFIPGNIRRPRNRFAKKFICGHKIKDGKIVFFNGSGMKMFLIPFKEGKLVIHK